MTSKELDEIRSKYALRDPDEWYSVVDVDTKKEVVRLAGRVLRSFSSPSQGCPRPNSNVLYICKKLGLTSLAEFNQFLIDVKEGRNLQYVVYLDGLDIKNQDEINKRRQSTILSNAEWKKEEEKRAIRSFVGEQLKDMESYLVLPRNNRRVPAGFVDWGDFKSYYKQLHRWYAWSNAGWIKDSIPPLRDGVKIVHTGTLETYETPAEKVAQTGCAVIGFGWFGFIGVSFVICVLMGIGGCLKGCSLEKAYTEEQLEMMWP